MCSLRGRATASLISMLRHLLSPHRRWITVSQAGCASTGKHLPVHKQAYAKKEQILAQTSLFRATLGRSSHPQARHGFLEASAPRSMKRTICSQYCGAAAAQRWCLGEASSRCSGSLFDGLGSGHCSLQLRCSVHIQHT